MIIEQQSVVEAPIEAVWARVITPAGINHEMLPWLTMSVPGAAHTMTIDTVPIGEPVGRAWIRLFGVIPFDYDDLTIAELVPGQRFHEKSTMLSMRRWEHQRSLTDLTDGRTTVHDRVTFEPRIGGERIASVVAPVLRAFFARRHRRLQESFSAHRP